MNIDFNHEVWHNGYRTHAAWQRAADKRAAKQERLEKLSAKKRVAKKSLGFELMAWNRVHDECAAKKAQLEKLATLKVQLEQLASIHNMQLETNTCSNLTIKTFSIGIVPGPKSGHDISVSNMKSAELFDWMIMAALTIFTASILCFAYTLWAA